jgi:hypothetical protein
VITHSLEEKALDLLLAKLAGKGLIGAGGKQRTDSTHVISAVRDLNRLGTPTTTCSPRTREWSRPIGRAGDVP